MGDVYFDDFSPKEYSELMTQVCKGIDPCG